MEVDCTNCGLILKEGDAAFGVTAGRVDCMLDGFSSNYEAWISVLCPDCFKKLKVRVSARGEVVKAEMKQHAVFDGACPKCGENDFNHWFGSGLTDFEYTCNGCGHKFETFKLEYLK